MGDNNSIDVINDDDGVLLHFLVFLIYVDIVLLVWCNSIWYLFGY
jgi:hypothetical protein